MRYHTGDQADHVKGLFQCQNQECKETIRMKGNYQDHFPPCPYCKDGVDYVQVNLSK